MIIGIFGLSGVGKTTFSKKLSSKYPELSRFSASELIAKFDGEVNYDKLKSDIVLNNQKKLMDALAGIRRNSSFGDLIIELHNIIETEEGVFLISKDILTHLGLDEVFFMCRPAEQIWLNRKKDNKKRRSISEVEIEKMQLTSLNYFLETFKKRNKHVITGSDDDVDNFYSFFDHK